MNSASPFDLGPLTWVKSEIDLALDRAGQAIDQFGANPQDVTQVKFCRTHLHQVRGALSIVGLDGVTQFADALERLLAAIEEGRQPGNEPRIKLIAASIAAVRHYLDDLLAGEPNQPLRLLDLYQKLASARGEASAPGSDLFFPDLSIRPTLPARRDPARAGIPRMKAGRARFQKGLLGWLQAPTRANGPVEMQSAATEIGDADEAPIIRAFWWVAAALFSGFGKITSIDPEVKRLLPRIDQQTRRQMEGSRTVPERLMRDLLYHVATIPTATPELQAVRQNYGLENLVPASSENASAALRIEPLLKRLRELSGGVEEAWNKFCGGSPQALASARELAITLHQGGEKLGHTDFRRLTKALGATVAWLAEKPARHSEMLAIEVATAILLVSNAIESFTHLGPDFVHQVDVMVARLHACIAGTALPPGTEIPTLDEMTRRAQEKLLIAQVAREIQTNLGQIEQALDTYFRDASQNEPLASLSAPLHQIEGALMILGQDAAVNALRASGDRIARFARPQYKPATGEFEAVASQLSALGFFIEALQSGAPNYLEFVRQLEAGPRLRKPAPESEYATSEDAPTGIIPAAAVREEPAPIVAPVPDEAVAPVPAPEDVVVPDAPVVLAPELSLEVEAAPAPIAEPAPIIEIPATVEVVAEPEPAVAAQTAVVPAPETQATAEEVDAELLEIFLEEANEVLQTIGDALDTLRGRIGDADALTTIRRAFHTLKGSSRMVGLMAFGDVAWAVEQVHNLWLRQELEANADLLKLIEDSCAVFSEWVSHLEQHDGIVPDTTGVVAAANRLKGSGADAPLPVVAVPTPAPATPAEPEAAIEFAAISLDDVPVAEAVPETTAIAETPEAAADTFDLSLPQAEAEQVEAPTEELVTLEAIELADLGTDVPEPSDSVADAEPIIEPTVEFVALPDLAPEPPLETEPEISADALDLVFDEETPAIELAIAELAPPVDEQAAEQAPSELVADFEIEFPADVVAEIAVAEADQAVAETPPEAEVFEIPPDASMAAEEPALTYQTITVSPTLRQIFLDEAKDHLHALQQHFGDLEIEPSVPTSIDMVRAAHTLGSIAGTVGFDQIKRLGRALEESLLRRDHSEHLDSLEAMETVRQVIAELELLVAAVGAGETPSDTTSLVEALSGIYEVTKTTSVEHAPEAGLISTAVLEPIIEAPIEDKLDEQLLPIFLEEAADLVGGINERLSMWRDNPHDTDSIHALARLLHTLKGSARMAGAMRIGAGTHALESSIEEIHRAGEADAAAIVELQLSFDEIALAIEALQDAPAAEAAAPDFDFQEVESAEAAAEIAHAPQAATPQEIIATPVAPAAPAHAAPAPAAEPVPRDALDDQLLPIFLEEAQELTKAVYEHFSTLAANPADPDASHGLARALHTLKGSARMAGAMSLGAMSHTLESRLESAKQAGTPEPGLIDDLRSAFDLVVQVIDRLQHGEEISTITLEAPEAPVEIQPAIAQGDAAAVKPLAAETAHAEPVEAAPTVQIAAHKDEGHQRPMLRVRAEMMDRLVNDAGELSIARARIEGEMRGLKQSLLDLTENVIRLRRQLREIEIQAEGQIQSRIAQAHDAQFDPLELDRFTRFQELTRMMAESVNDVATVQQNLLRSLDESNAALAAQARLNRELQQELMSVRMVPFSSLTERLYRIVRQTAKEVGKRVDLEMKGGQIELDQNVINKMIGPFEHLLRNAISHGIETPEERVAAGKETMGEITLVLRQEGNEVVLSMSDDGAGLNYERIRAKAIATGLLRADEPADEARLATMIFETGFSTASTVTQLSGRGVGMDVVKTEVGSLGGRIEIKSETGRGTTFRIYLPLTLALTNGLLVRVGTRVYAVPSSMIDQVMEMREEALGAIRDSGQAQWQGGSYPFHFLPHLLGEPQALPEARRRYWVLLLHSGDRRVSVQVDELLGSQEIVVKNIGPQLSRVSGIAGATVLGDGQVILILNPVALSARAPLIQAATVAAQTAAPAAPAEPEAMTLPTVLVVDDSLTVRKVTGRLLAREGYQVITAKDGVDALEQLVELMPDVILSDIEMPRMDGFELARNIRSDERLKPIPIIMITSRTADKHRSHASELGVDHFLGKPYQEDELLRLVADYVAARRGAH